MRKARKNWRLFPLVACIISGLLLGGCASGTESSQTSEPTGDNSSKAPATSGLRVDTEKQSVDIIREEEGGNQRLVYLQLTNGRNGTYEGYSLVYEANGQTVKRELGRIGSQQTVLYDTCWLPVDVESVEAAVKNDAGELAWSGTLTVKKADRECVIRQSTVYNPDDLTPLCIRGINYYPRNAAWQPLSMQEQYWEEELDDFVPRLHVNAIRFIADFQQHGSRKAGNVPTPEYLERVNKLLELAAERKVKVLFCLYPDRPQYDDGMNFRYVRAAMEPFMNDGRILMWDLINEVDAWIHEQPHYSEFVEKYYPMMKDFDPNHITNIALTNLIEPVAKLVDDFDVWQYHYYWKPQAEFMLRAERTYFPGKPYIIGEFGCSSMDSYLSLPNLTSSEELQREVYQEMFDMFPKLVEMDHNLVGTFSWTVYDFPSHASDDKNGEGFFGIIREDGSLKPAGEVLVSHYAEWKTEHPAPWD